MPIILVPATPYHRYSWPRRICAFLELIFIYQEWRASDTLSWTFHCCLFATYTDLSHTSANNEGISAIAHNLQKSLLAVGTELESEGPGDVVIYLWYVRPLSEYNITPCKLHTIHKRDFPQSIALVQDNTPDQQSQGPIELISLTAPSIHRKPHGHNHPTPLSPRSSKSFPPRQQHRPSHPSPL